MHYFKREWHESRGDQYNDWGASTWYFETGEDMWPVRQIEVYVNGNVLHYDRHHAEDEFGGLSLAALDADDFESFVILQIEFEHVWDSLKPMNR
jgi:hypothetical protein